MSQKSPMKRLQLRLRRTARKVIEMMTETGMCLNYAITSGSPDVVAELRRNFNTLAQLGGTLKSIEVKLK